jgi:hypothetical protein
MSEANIFYLFATVSFSGLMLAFFIQAQKVRLTYLWLLGIISGLPAIIGCIKVSNNIIRPELSDQIIIGISLISSFFALLASHFTKHNPNRQWTREEVAKGAYQDVLVLIIAIIGLVASVPIPTFPGLEFLKFVDSFFSVLTDLMLAYGCFVLARNLEFKSMAYISCSLFALSALVEGFYWLILNEARTTEFSKNYAMIYRYTLYFPSLFALLLMYFSSIRNDRRSTLSQN